MYAFSTIVTLLGFSSAFVSGLSIPEPLARRDWCDTLTKFSESDARLLQNDLQNSDEVAYVPAHSYHFWDKGSARICVWNDYIFENTHVSAWEAGWAIGYINNLCCTGGEGSEW
jgi:hypothetical protein